MSEQECISYIIENNKKHIIFDFDETLCTLHIDWHAWVLDLEKFIRTFDPNFSMSQVDNLAIMQNEYTARFGNPFKDALISFNRETEKKYYSGYTPIHPSLALLPQASKLANLYIWTTNDTATISPILKELHIEQCFKKIIGRNNITYIKPNSDGFQYIYEKDTPLEQYLFIGDSNADRQAAQSAKIDFLHVNDLE